MAVTSASARTGRRITGSVRERRISDHFKKIPNYEGITLALIGILNLALDVTSGLKLCMTQLHNCQFKLRVTIGKG